MLINSDQNKSQNLLGDLIHKTIKKFEDITAEVNSVDKFDEETKSKFSKYEKDAQDQYDFVKGKMDKIRNSVINFIPSSLIDEMKANCRKYLVDAQQIDVKADVLLEDWFEKDQKYDELLKKLI